MGRRRPLAALGGNLPAAWARDLLVHGDELAVATQGRAIWVLDDLALLRQAAPGATWPGPRLFDPAPTVRVRASVNHDTPVPPEEPAGRNPPAGAVIDYWLPAPAKGPVTVDIVDASGALVQRLSSEPSPRPNAEVYFAPDWLHPAAPLDTAAGLHRAVWNLRWPRPPAISFAYSIAATAGVGAPITPQGPLALPGDYSVVLTVDGVQSRAPLRLVQDPRSRAGVADLQASLELSKAIAGDLALARKGYGEIAAGHEGMAEAFAQLRAKGADPALLARGAAFITHTESPEAERDFFKDAKILAALESDLEGADLAPTEPQRAARVRTRADLDARWAAWTALRDRELPALNAGLARAGLRLVTIPPEDRLPIDVPEGAEDLP